MKRTVMVADPRLEAWLRYHDLLFGVGRRRQAPKPRTLLSRLRGGR